MVEWITNYIDYVENRPQDFNDNVKNNVRQIKALLRQPEIEYKDGDVKAFVEYCKYFIQEEGEWAGKPISLNREQLYVSACILGIKIYSPQHKMWLRYFKELDLFVARKWGKDHFITPLATFLVGFDREPSAWCQILAENMKQASRTYELMTKATKTRPLSDFFTEKRGQNPELQCPSTKGKIEPMSGRTKGKDGSNPSCIVINEAHEITNFSQYTSMKTAMNSRRQPLMIVISSAGTTPESLYESLYERNRNFLSKRKLGANDRIFALMFGIDDSDLPDDDTKWIKANPAMCDNRPSLQDLRIEWASSKDNPILRNAFISKQLNRQIGATIDFFDMIKIKNCMRKVMKKEYFDSYAVGGVDLAETTDLCNATAMVMTNKGKLIILQAYFMAEERIAKNSKHDKEDYIQYENTGTDDIITSRILITTPGDYVAKEYVTKWFMLLRDEYAVNFLKIGYDSWHANEWLTDMVNHGFSMEKCEKTSDGVIERDDGLLTEVIQGAKTLSEPIKIVKTLFDDGKIIFDSQNKLLPYCFYNLKFGVDSQGQLSPNKLKSTGHIDGAMGIFDAFVAYQRAKAMEDYKIISEYFQI